MRQSVIYVVGSQRSPVKIGYAASLSARLSSLQCGNPDELVVHYSLRAPHGVGKAIEREIHKALAAHHRRGEWFDIDAGEAFRIVEAVASDFLEANRRIVAQRGDIIDKLWADYPLDPDVRGALELYRKEAARKSGKHFVARAHGFVLKRCGQVTLNVFRAYLDDGSGLFASRRDLPEEVIEKARAALAAALNALADFCAAHRQDVLLKKIAA